ncbi:hypothetical protein ILUMI_21447 [Ignelater luminosus]|uniref:Uncharacterized protein n=1 Tax=Ignelater luminosus TaxID=2038154 RepID=A0A8K0CFK6_IGNLU|nr:hypothetical protein ILUMI_21447 [Ignelater luminosus]
MERQQIRCNAILSFRCLTGKYGKKWDNSKLRVEVSCLNVVNMYNKKIGGADICDEMVVLHLFDKTVVNSWVENKRDCKSEKAKSKSIMDLLNFRLDLEYLDEYLVSGTKKRRTAEEVELKEEASWKKRQRRRKTNSPIGLSQKTCHQ